MDLTAAFADLGIALGLGLLVGLQRERAAAPLAGVRTFPLVTMLGSLCALLTAPLGTWMLPAGLLALAALVVSGNAARLRAGDADPGLTTDAALLLMFCVGGYLVEGDRPVAVALGGAVAVLLHLKPQLHSLARGMGEEDFRAIMQFVVISLVILPVLPNRSYGPFKVLNPQRIWLMVVLIVGISLGGYVVYKLFGSKVGAPVGGLLGGLISSTATTVSYARLSRETPTTTGLATVVICLASTVVFGRVLAILAAVCPEGWSAAAPPLLLMLAGMSALSLAVWFRARKEPGSLPAHRNPSELKPALAFTALFALVLVAVAAAKEYFGQRGLFAVAVLSGLTDMDAITLSSAQMVHTGRIGADTMWRLVLAGAMANMVFKWGTVMVLGDRMLGRSIAATFAAALAMGGLILALM